MGRGLSLADLCQSTLRYGQKLIDCEDVHSFLPSLKVTTALLQRLS